ncbi:MAG: hypothetical protein ABGX16_15995, partial [Pirellulales bacterium]
IYDALDTGGERILLHWTTYEPGVVPGNPKWEIPDLGISWAREHLQPPLLDPFDLRFHYRYVKKYVKIAIPLQIWPIFWAIPGRMDRK